MTWKKIHAAFLPVKIPCKCLGMNGLKNAIIHLVRKQNFPKNQDFVPPDAHGMCAYYKIKNVNF